MQRRRWIEYTLTTLGVGALSACGFRLRRIAGYAFKSVFVQAAPNSALGAEILRQLRASDVQVLTEAIQKPQAEVVLQIVQERPERVVVGTNAAGQVRELELRMTVVFRLVTPQGIEWIEPAELYQQRDLSFSETAALSKEVEEAALYREMQRDMAQQILRRLARVQPPALR